MKWLPKRCECGGSLYFEEEWVCLSCGRRYDKRLKSATLTREEMGVALPKLK